jgi:hypothetical protein
MLERADTAGAIGLNRRASALLDQLGVVQTLDGLPIYHEVFAGNTADLDEDESKR